MLSHKEVADEVFDLVLTDPPYSDMMAKERTGQRKKLYNDSTPKPYTELRADLGNIPIDEFLVELNIGYTGKSQLMDNYGWVQNTSNLSTIRDTVDLIPSEGVDHNSLMRSIYSFRKERGDLRSKWTWDARCRIKANILYDFARCFAVHFPVHQLAIKE